MPRARRGLGPGAPARRSRGLSAFIPRGAPRTSCGSRSRGVKVGARAGRPGALRPRPFQARLPIQAPVLPNSRGLQAVAVSPLSSSLSLALKTKQKVHSFPEEHLLKLSFPSCKTRLGI